MGYNWSNWGLISWFMEFRESIKSWCFGAGCKNPWSFFDGKRWFLNFTRKFSISLFIIFTGKISAFVYVLEERCIRHTNNPWSSKLL